MKGDYIMTKTKMICLAAVASGCLGYVIGDVVSTARIASGLKKFHEAGILRFYDEDDECGIERAVTLIKELHKNK